jgi:protoporphyrinogen oxidase
MRGGMGALAHALASGLDVRYGQRVTRLEAEGPTGPVSITASGGGEVTYRAQGAVITTPSDAALDLWPGAPGGSRRLLESTAYSDSFLVFLRTKERFQRVDRRGKELYMEVIPGGATLQALLFLNSVAPDGGLVAATATPAARRSPDHEALAARLESEAVELYPELRDQVVARRAVRIPKVVPLFPAGRARELQAFRSRLAAGPVQLAGDYLYGPCMESAAQAGRAAAERLHAHIRPDRTAAPGACGSPPSPPSGTPAAPA